MAQGAPQIEGSLKTTIHALAFGLICATLAVNFGKFFVPHFFPYMVGIVIVIEVVLFSLDRPKDNYEKFQVHGIKGTHTIEGAGAPKISVSAPNEDPETTPRKRDKIKEKLKPTKKDQKGRRGSGAQGSGSPSRQGLVPPPSPGQEAIAEGKETEHEKGKDKSAEKERKKEEEKGKKKEKEEEKEKQKAEKKEEKEKGKEGDEEKSEKGTWRKKLSKGNKQNSV